MNEIPQRLPPILATMHRNGSIGNGTLVGDSRMSSSGNGATSATAPLPGHEPVGDNQRLGRIPSERWKRRALWCVLVGVLGLAGLAWALATPGGSRRTEKPMVPERVAANGLVEGASREIALFPEVAGTLAALHVQVNQEVKAGAPLFELHNETQKAQVALAEAELTSAEAQLEQAKADWGRSQSIHRMQSGAISAQAVDADRCRWLVGQARVAETAARLRLAKAELAKTQVRSPIAGRVLQIHHEPGTLVEPRKHGDPVLRLADVSRRRVRAWVEELDVAKVAVGQRAELTADGFSGKTFTGRVVEVAGRMGKDAPHSDAPGEYRDVYYREVVIELDGGEQLPLNLRVQVYIEGQSSRRPETMP